MRAKSERRLLAEKLRRQHGLSYNQIAAQTGISKSTLSYWLRDLLLTPEQEARLQARLEAVQATFAARALPINRKRYRLARERAYQIGVDIVERLNGGQDINE
ncbi:MAG: helix-turn-helix domain-containing protein [Anaerolineales bacterium]|nr:helix-turn-helix domain-containing protein [Anaerolineales bacterium]